MFYVPHGQGFIAPTSMKLVGKVTVPMARRIVASLSSRGCRRYSNVEGSEILSWWRLGGAHLPVRVFRYETEKAPQPLMAGAAIRGLVETGEGWTLPSHKILNLLAERKALSVHCGTIYKATP
jgi:hypothetical protein